MSKPLVLRSFHDQDHRLVYTIAFPDGQPTFGLADSFVPQYCARDDNRIWLGNLYGEIVSYDGERHEYTVTARIAKAGRAVK